MHSAVLSKYGLHLEDKLGHFLKMVSPMGDKVFQDLHFSLPPLPGCIPCTLDPKIFGVDPTFLSAQQHHFFN